MKPDVDKLLSLKADFKKLTGKEWKPGMTETSPPAATSAATASAAAPSVSGEEGKLLDAIAKQGDVVRTKKAGGASKVATVAFVEREREGGRGRRERGRERECV